MSSAIKKEKKRSSPFLILFEISLRVCNSREFGTDWAVQVHNVPILPLVLPIFGLPGLEKEGYIRKCGDVRSKSLGCGMGGGMEEKGTKLKKAYSGT